MKIYSNNAEAFIRALSVNTVLVYGNDVGGVKTMAKRIIKRFLGEEDEQESVRIIPAEEIKENEGLVLDEINSKGFFSAKKLVWLTDPPESSASLLEEVFKSLDSESFLLITGGELKRESKFRKIYEDGKNHTALLCYKEEGANLKRHITDWFAANKISADYDALEYVTANLGEDKLITQNELEKIALYLGNEKRLSFEGAVEILADNSELAMNDILYAITCKTPKLLEKSLARAFADNMAAVAITRGLLWHLNRLLSAKIMIQNGMSQDSVVESLRLFFKHKELFKTSLRKWNIEALQNAVKAVNQLELEVKSNFGDSDMLLRDKFLKLAA